jgi:polysaccharide biosynthesis transport protein
VELTDYIRILRHNWRLVAAALAVSLLLAAVITATADRMYSSRTQVYVSTVATDSATDLAQASTYTQRQITTYADLVTTPLILGPVADQIGAGSLEDLSTQVSASVAPQTALITITATTGDPQRSADLANAVAAQFATSVADLERVDDAATSPVKATPVETATVSTSPVAPSPVRNLALAGVLGLLVGLGLALLRDLLDTRIAGEADVKRVTEATVIGGIPFAKSAAKTPLIVHDDPHSTRAETFRSLRTNLQFVNAAEHPRSIVFTSSLPEEGKTTTTANLALALTEAGSSVCLIEGDLRRPRLLDYMGLVAGVGLTNVLIGEVEVDEVLQSFGDRLDVLGCGPIPPNPSELLASRQMATLLHELENRYDYVIIDAPPLLPVTDAAVLSKVADGTIVVVGAKIIRREHLSRAIEALAKVDANVLGVVLNRIPAGGPGSYSYYDSGYYTDDATVQRRGRILPARRGRETADA